MVNLNVRESTTTLLDVIGLLLVAAGLAGGAWTYIGAWALVIAGAVVLAGSWFAASRDDEGPA